MLTNVSAHTGVLKQLSSIKGSAWLFLFASGMLIPFGFAPFHLPGAAILGISVFYAQTQTSTPAKAWLQGLVFGLGWFGFGISWVSISIHHYGHLVLPIAYLITAVFVVYLALFPALCGFLLRCLTYPGLPAPMKALLFSSLWCLSEYLRASCFTGFPWLILGFGQIDTPLRYLLPITGIYGLSFFAVLAAGCLTHAVRKSESPAWLLGSVLLLIAPSCLSTHPWSIIENTPLTVGVIQSNLSMRDKWDETVFREIIEHYQKTIQALLGKKQIILLPESAIPLPANYIQDFLSDLDHQAQTTNTALLFGIPEAINHSDPNNEVFYNTLSTLGPASGVYRKQHLVPFGEYIPSSFARMLSGLDLGMSDMQAGPSHQSLVLAHNRPFATLICYELAYPELLRQQLSEGQWIVSISDDGWFGHSLASYQHLQMAQALSMLSSRYQMVANNDGLSSIISPQGTIEQALPAFTAGVVDGIIFPAHGSTPWVTWGDKPILGLCLVIVLALCLTKVKHLKPYFKSPNQA